MRLFIRPEWLCRFYCFSVLHMSLKCDGSVYTTMIYNIDVKIDIICQFCIFYVNLQFATIALDQF